MPSKQTFLMVASAHLFLPVLLYVFIGSGMPAELKPLSYVFAAVPLMAFPILLLMRRVKTANLYTAALMALSVAELGVLMAIFVGMSQVGALIAMGVAIPVMLAITLFVLLQWGD